MEVNFDNASRLLAGEPATEFNAQLANLAAVPREMNNDEGRNESQPYGDDGQYCELNRCNPSDEYRVSLYLCDFVEQVTFLTFAHRTPNNRKRVLNSCVIYPDEPLHNLVNFTTAENIPNFPNSIAAISNMSRKLISKILMTPNTDC